MEHIAVEHTGFGEYNQTELLLEALAGHQMERSEVGEGGQMGHLFQAAAARQIECSGVFQFLMHRYLGQPSNDIMLMKESQLAIAI